MQSPNLMKFFVTDEDGTSALFATAFDPQLADNRQKPLWEKFCNHLQSMGVDLPSENGPQIVLQQYSNIDLLMLWGDWVLLIENKVAAASITRGQLSRYYRSAVQEMERGMFLASEGVEPEDARRKRICVVYLTPTKNTGTEEFTSTMLEPDRTDAKVHLSWEDVLEVLRDCFPGSSPSDALGRLVQDGCRLTEDILRQRSKPVIEETDQRVKMKAFLTDVRDAVETMLAFQPNVRLRIWRDRNVDQLYGNIGGGNGNVYFTILADRTPDFSNLDNVVLQGSVSFSVAGKAIRKRREDFCAVRATDCGAFFGLNPDNLKIDEERCSVMLENVWRGTHAELVEEIASLFCRFLLFFKPLMEEQPLIDS